MQSLVEYVIDMKDDPSRRTMKYQEHTSELHRMNHAHPTLSEVLKEAAAAVSREAIHF